ncbi:MAG TPA: hypothetical protein VFP50_15395 [Anaeromyxobacteraceae bacterium]|nr:hypothetical protein [Anaeromyxobacteraceae bacterium]
MLARPARKPRPRPSIRTAQQPAPVGGIDSISPATELPALNCHYAYNLIASEGGVRVRLGYQVTAEGLGGSADSTVRTMVPFHGSDKNGSTDKLFAVTSLGIWDVTAGGTTTTPVGPNYTYNAINDPIITFDNAAGIRPGDTLTDDITGGIAHVIAIDGNDVMLDTTDDYSAPGTCTDQTYSPVAPLALAVSFSITSGDAGYCTYHSFTTSAGKFLLLCDEENGYYVYTESTGLWTKPTMGGGAGQIAGVNPANLVFVTAWKNRVWLVEKSTSKAWYLDVNAIYGTATAFDFGTKMRAGGSLVGLWNWSYDGGAGMDTLLVGVSSAGDIVIYQGTDPTSADTFGLKGCWSAGAVPSGRRIATDYGGDLLLLSLLGAVPLSKLVIGNPAVDRTVYSTEKIAPLFNQLAALYRDLHGWALHIHPLDNALLVFVPQAEGSATTQLAMAFANRSWWLYRDLPMLSACTWDGDFYFGTEDGRVCRNYGYRDNVPRVVSFGDNTGSAIDWSLLTPFRTGGAPTNKQVQMIRPTLLSGDVAPVYQATARYNLNLAEPGAVSGTPSGDSNSWDVGLWDSMLWQDGTRPSAALTGGTGLGREVAIALRGNANSKTTLVVIDVYFTEGGLL